MFSWKHSFNHIIAQGACAARSAVARRELPGCCGWYVFVLCLPRARPVFAPVCGLTPPALMCERVLVLSFVVGCSVWGSGGEDCSVWVAGGEGEGKSCAAEQERRGTGKRDCRQLLVMAHMPAAQCAPSSLMLLPVCALALAIAARRTQGRPSLFLCLQLSLHLMPVVPPVKRSLTQCSSCVYSSVFV